MSISVAIGPLRRGLRFGPLWLAIPGVIFLVIFFVVPVLRMLVLSIHEGEGGALSTVHYERLADTSIYFRVLLNTLNIAALTAFFSVVLGYPVAYWLSRLPAEKRSRMLLLVLVPFWTSWLIKTFAWMLILGQSGVINRLLLSTGIADRPISMLFGNASVMIGMVHIMLPLVILTMLPVMNEIDRKLEHAASTLGAPGAQTFWLIYFPLSLSGVAAGGLLAFISSLGFFIVPALLGGPSQTMIAQLIIVEVQQMLNWAFAGAMAAMILVTTLTTCWVYDAVFGLSTLSGTQGEGPKRLGTKLRVVGNGILRALAQVSDVIVAGTQRIVGGGRSAWVLPFYVAALIFFLLAPTFVILPIGFTSSPFLEFPPPGYSLKWFEVYFNSPVWISATLRSFGVAFATGVIATLLGGFAALACARSRSRWVGILFAFFLAPMIVPRIVVAVGLFYLFAKLGLVATDLGLTIGNSVLALPFAFVAVAAFLKTYDRRLDQAAAVLGANRLQTLRHVTVPLIKGGLAVAFLFAFITSFDELTISLFVSGGSKTTLPKQMWDDMTMQLNPTLASVSVLVLAMVMCLLLLIEWFRRPAQ